jgi:hypothetical protein
MEFNSVDIIKTETADLIKLNEYIVVVEFYDGCEVTKENAAEIRDKAITLFNGGKFFSIIDGTKAYATLSNETLSYFAQDSKLANHRMAQAIVVNTIALSMIANFYLKFKNPTRPVKIFDKINKAKIWLESQKYLLQ